MGHGMKGGGWGGNEKENPNTPGASPHGSQKPNEQSSFKPYLFNTTPEYRALSVQFISSHLP